MKSFINFIMTVLYGRWDAHYCEKPTKLDSGTVVERQFVFRRWKSGGWQLRAMSPGKQEDIRVYYAIK